MALTKGLTSGDSMFNSVADLQASKSRIKTIVSTNDGTTIQFYTVSASDLGSGVVLDSGLFANPIGVASIPDPQTATNTGDISDLQALQLNITTPVNALPVNGATDVSTTPTLTASAFSGTDIHINSIWRVYSDSGGTVQVYSSGASNDLVSHTVPASANLANETELFFDVQYVGVEAISSKSTLTSFTTEVALSSVHGVTAYAGSASVQSIINGRDFVSRTGMAWIKNLDASSGHVIVDTLRGVNQVLTPDANGGQAVVASIPTFNSDGYDLAGGSIRVSTPGNDFVSIDFLVEAGFFEMVNWTGDATGVRNVSHNLNHEIGFMIHKGYSAATGWFCWHKDMATNMRILLDTNAAQTTEPNFLNSTTPTTTVFTAGTGLNLDGISFISYLFAHNPDKGIFCGSHNGISAAGNKQTTNFKVGFLLIVVINAVGSWEILDIIRSPANPVSDIIKPDLPDAETVSSRVNFLSDGFDFTGSALNTSGQTYVWVAVADGASF